MSKRIYITDRSGRSHEYLSVWANTYDNCVNFGVREGDDVLPQFMELSLEQVVELHKALDIFIEERSA